MNEIFYIKENILSSPLSGALKTQYHPWPQLLKKGLFLLFLLSITLSLWGGTPRDYARLYYQNTHLQMQWALSMIEKLELRQEDTILDYGCRDGKITAWLAQKVTHGRVCGIDLSEEMQSFASKMFPKKMYPNLEFSSAITSQPNTFDWAILMSILHVVDYPSQLLKTIHTTLKPTGKIAIVLPFGGHPILYDTLRQLKHKHHVSFSLLTHENIMLRTYEGIQSLLTQCGFAIDHSETLSTTTAFASKADFASWLEATFADVWHITPEKRSLFFQDFVEIFCQKTPSSLQEGVVYFEHQRLELIASKRS